MKGSIVGLLAATALVSGVSHAEGQSFDDRIYGGVLLNYIDADNDMRRINDSRDGVRALLGKRLSPWFALEGTASFNEFGRYGVAPPKSRPQKEASLALEGLVYPFKCTGQVDPFVKAGVGGVYFNEDDTALKVSVGAGLDWTVADNGLKVRTDAAWRYMDTDEPVPSPLGDNPTEWVIGAGLILPFGDAPKVDEGCAKMAPKPAPAKDTTPEEPAAPAAPMDSDGDGVIDADDKCPNTPPGTKVDANGCPVPETVVIYFAFDSSELNSAAKAALDRVAANLVNKNFVVAIANGHADRTGTEEYNMGLSERRASSVANYLAGKGVESGDIRQRAYGETRPAAPGDTEIGRAKNRRVEINLLRQ